MGIYKIGSIIKHLRTKKQFTQKQLAEGICSVEYISKIEHGTKTPSLEIASKLLHRLGVNPNFFFTSLSTTDNDLYSEHRYELEHLLAESRYADARSYIQSLQKDFPFYASGEPHQYLMGKESHILANLDKDFDSAYDTAYHSILLTKPDFKLENKEQYDFYSVNELWSLLYMSTALYWKMKDLKLETGLDTAIHLSEFILRHLDKGYLHPSIIGTLYASTIFYHSRYLTTAEQYHEAVSVSDKGIQFLTKHYNQHIELLGKIMINIASCSYAQNHLSEAKEYYDVGRTLLLLSANKETLHWYLDIEFEQLLQLIK